MFIFIVCFFLSLIALLFALSIPVRRRRHSVGTVKVSFGRLHSNLCTIEEVPALKEWAGKLWNLNRFLREYQNLPDFPTNPTCPCPSCIGDLSAVAKIGDKWGKGLEVALKGLEVARKDLRTLEAEVIHTVDLREKTMAVKVFQLLIDELDKETKAHIASLG